MMYGYGSGSWWMMLMPLLWIGLIAVIVWALVRLIRPRGDDSASRRDDPLEILERRYARGEIDDAAYTTARANLTGREPRQAMTWLRRRWLPLLVFVAATATVVGSIAVTVGRDSGSRWPGGMGMMGAAAREDGPIRTLSDAQRAADQYGQRWGLHAGEVMQFDNGFYAELLDPAGNGATEVLIDRSGTVGLEYGPAMMWNTAYGMHRAGPGTGTTPISAQQASSIAQAWLQTQRPGEQAGQADAFPGYYTLHTMRDGQITGMLSVHATTGAVWYHSWHGTFIDMSTLD